MAYNKLRFIKSLYEYIVEIILKKKKNIHWTIVYYSMNMVKFVNF